VASLLQAIAQSVQRTFGRPIHVALHGEVPHMLPEAESIPVALTINELLTNAIKHGTGEDVRCTLGAQGEAVQIRIASLARLRPGFDLAAVRTGVSGLSLVRALLPRRSATLTLTQEGEDVVATIELRPPGVRMPAPPALPLAIEAEAGG
jgi:two-component sensor histidine kinase